MFQSTVNILQGFGLPGERLLDSPSRVESLIINSAGATPNIYGFAATKSTITNIAAMGGALSPTNIFAGIMSSPKEAQLSGTTAGGTLAATLAIPDNSQAEFCPMGDIVASIANACNIGDKVIYNLTTGALSAVAPTASFTASQSTNVLTVSAITAGSLGVGSVVVSAGAIIGEIVSLGTGTGGAGTYNLNTSATVASGAMTANSEAAAGYAIVPNSQVYRYPVTNSGGGLTAVRLTN